MHTQPLEVAEEMCFILGQRRNYAIPCHHHYRLVEMGKSLPQPARGYHGQELKITSNYLFSSSSCRRSEFPCFNFCLIKTQCVKLKSLLYFYWVFLKENVTNFHLKTQFEIPSQKKCKCYKNGLCSRNNPVLPQTVKL